MNWGLEPVRQYDLARYPTRSEFEGNRPPILSKPLVRLAAAGFITGALFVACDNGRFSLLKRDSTYNSTNSTSFFTDPWTGGVTMGTGPPATSTGTSVPSYMAEQDARCLIIPLFLAEDVTFQSDYQYSENGVECNLDGYNEELGIGYEYESQEDYYARIANPSRAEIDYLDSGEKQTIQAWKNTEGDAILVIPKCYEGQDYWIINQVSDFIQWLKDNGKL